MAQDPGLEENSGEEMVTLFNSSNIDAELEANTIHSILETNAIPSIVVGASVLPLEFQVQVPRKHLEEARKAIAEAQAAGPAGAAEAEAATERER